MRLTTGRTIEIKGGYKGKNQRLIWEFANSGEPCALVKGWKHKTEYSCKYALTKAAQSTNLPQIYVLIHRGKIYLINTQI